MTMSRRVRDVRVVRPNVASEKEEPLQPENGGFEPGRKRVELKKNKIQKKELSVLGFRV